MDGTKRTAFAATIYFLEAHGHPRPPVLPEEEVIRFCLELAGENMRIAAGEDIQPKTIAQITAWLKELLEGEGETS